MTVRRISYIAVLAGFLAASGVLLAQDKPAGEHLDESIRLEIQARIDQYLGDLQGIYDAAIARLPVSEDSPITEGYLRVLERRIRTTESSLRSFDIRWNNYYPSQQWAVALDETLMSSVERLELMKQDAGDSLEVRRQMFLSLQSFMEAQSMFEGLDSTYNNIGKRAFELSLTQKTAPLLEKEKQKEQLLFASVQEKFDAAKKAKDYGLVSDERMAALEDSYAALKNKSDTIQQMTYKPLIQRIKDYLLAFAAVAVLLMFISMLRARIKSIKDTREAMKKYKETLKLNGTDEYPTI
ncbi:MAG: hypothetical protein IKP46_08150 [Bacteroidales bacterium]|nr:hypothetical protein [Bacteroidales bacterium]